MKYRISVELESAHKPRIVFAMMLSMAFLMGAGLSFVGPARAGHQHPDMRDPILHVTVYPLDSNDILLDWDPFPMGGGSSLDYTLIYKSITQTGFDLDLDNPWKDTRYDPNPLYGDTIVRDATKWLDENVNDPFDSEYKEECYYLVIAEYDPAVVWFGSSNTGGKWTHTFDEEYGDWALPFDYYPGIDYSQPGWVNTVEEYLNDMGAGRIGWIEGGYWQFCYPLQPCPMEVVLGDGFTASYYDELTHYYTYVGQPGAQLDWDEYYTVAPSFDPIDTAGMIDVDVNGHDVTITWEHIGADEYCVYYSNSRIGVFGVENINFWWLDCVAPGVGITHLDVAYPGTELYYWVRPLTRGPGWTMNGNPTYTIGVWTSDWEDGSDYAGLPLRPYDNYAYPPYYRLSYYCSKIPNMVGLSYLTQGVWEFHACDMPPGVYDPYWEMRMGVQTSSTGSSYFSHTGV